MIGPVPCQIGCWSTGTYLPTTYIVHYLPRYSEGRYVRQLCSVHTCSRHWYAPSTHLAPADLGSRPFATANENPKSPRSRDALHRCGSCHSGAGRPDCSAQWCAQWLSGPRCGFGSLQFVPHHGGRKRVRAQQLRCWIVPWTTCQDKYGYSSVQGELIVTTAVPCSRSVRPFRHYRQQKSRSYEWETQSRLKTCIPRLSYTSSLGLTARRVVPGTSPRFLARTVLQPEGQVPSQHYRSVTEAAAPRRGDGSHGTQGRFVAGVETRKLEHDVVLLNYPRGTS